jgi:hypothetical protein
MQCHIYITGEYTDPDSREIIIQLSVGGLAYTYTITHPALVQFDQWIELVDGGNHVLHFYGGRDEHSIRKHDGLYILTIRPELHPGITTAHMEVSAAVFEPVLRRFLLGDYLREFGGRNF